MAKTIMEALSDNVVGLSKRMSSGVARTAKGMGKASAGTGIKLSKTATSVLPKKRR